MARVRGLGEVFFSICETRGFQGYDFYRVWEPDTTPKPNSPSDDPRPQTTVMALLLKIRVTQLQSPKP